MFWLIFVTLFAFSSCVVDESVPEDCETALCSPVCGLSTRPEADLELGGERAKEKEMPWHVAVYNKDLSPYRHICGGTIIAPGLVLSAAHCFWSDVEKLKPPSKFAVAAGKVFRPWQNPRDSASQKSDVKFIRVPSRFRGVQTYLEGDIAILYLATPFVYDEYVRPICLDFDLGSERRDLRPGNLGSVAAWGLNNVTGKASQILQIVNLPYIDISKCVIDVPSYFRGYVTGDKVCAGYANGTALCERDRGGGLVFSQSDGTTRRYYLRGIFSTAPYNDQNGCSLDLAMFTQIRSYEIFIQENLKGIDKPTACTLPEYPDHGKYRVPNNPNAFPGDVLESFFLEYECDMGYQIIKDNEVFCVSGFQSKRMPKCDKVCRLDPHPSVEYFCHVPNSFGGTRQCELYEPDGVVVTANCRSPNYYSMDFLPNMKCSNGSWNYVATCAAVCGATTPKGEILVTGGRDSEKGEIPWHAGIYDKTETPYKQICGGSIIATTIIVTAAHCFWSDRRQELWPAERYAVAAGKLYRNWEDSRDDKVQRRDVIDIKKPERFRGRQTNYQEDIALAFLATTLVYDVHIRPVCIDFSYVLDRKQLAVGNLGKVAGWGLIDEEGAEAQKLQVVDLPYIDIKQCLNDAPFNFKEYITSDKICAGYTNGTALCKGDSGGGLAFPDQDRGEQRFYLRGVVSTAPNNEKSCNQYAVTTFTQIWRHEVFIKENYFGS